MLHCGWLRAGLRLSALLLLFGLPACLEEAVDTARQAVPFLPPPKYVTINGRKLTRAEAAYVRKLRDLSDATRVNPRDAVAYAELGRLRQEKGDYDLAKDLYYKAISLDDNLSEPHQRLGVLFLHEERYQGAAEELAKARALSPDDAGIRQHLAQAQAGLGETDAALKECDAALALDAEYVPAYLEKARLLYSLKRYGDAAAVCRAAVARVPSKPPAPVARETRGSEVFDVLLPTGQEEPPPPPWRQEAAYDLALCLKAQGQLREALAALEQASGVPEGEADVLILKARLLEASGDTRGAARVLEDARGEYPTLTEIPKRLAGLYAKLGEDDLARRTRLAAAELDYSDKALQEEAAREAEKHGDTARFIAICERIVRVDPEDVAWRRKLAKAYDDAGIKREAALAYQEVIARAPDDLAARRRAGALCAELPGFEGKALLQFKYILEKAPGDTESRRRLAELYLRLPDPRNLVEAEKHLRLVLEADPKDPEAHHNLGTLLARQNRFEDAVGEYRKTLALKPNHALALLNLSKVLLSLNRRDEAVVTLKQYLQLQPLDAEARLQRADACRVLGRREEALEEYQAVIALRPGDPLARLSLAQVYAGMGKTNEAIGIYETLLEKHPADTSVLREAARLYADLKLPLRAVFCWQRLLALKPDDTEAQSRLAEAYQAIGAGEAALAALEKVGQSGDAEAWRRAGRLRLTRHENDLAAAAFRQVLKLNPADIEARRQLADILRQAPVAPAGSGAAGEGREAAIPLYEEITQLDPKDEGARLNLANLYNDANRLSEALAQYETILRANPGNAAARLGHGVVQRKRGQYDAALADYLKAAELDPRAPAALYNLAIIYDFYLPDPAKAKDYYARYVAAGGDKTKVPEQR